MSHVTGNVTERGLWPIGGPDASREPPPGPRRAAGGSGNFKVVIMKLMLFKNKKSKGKILRVKQGYNPNSSSMGSIVFVLPAVLLVITVIFGTLSGLLGSILARHIDDPGKKIGRLYNRLQNIFLKRKINLV